MKEFGPLTFEGFTPISILSDGSEDFGNGIIGPSRSDREWADGISGELRKPESLRPAISSEPLLLIKLLPRKLRRPLYVLTSLGAIAAAKDCEPNPRHFLSLPFPPSLEMQVQQAWIYTNGSYHYATDYIKGQLDQSETWESFDVLAAADGLACANPSHSIGGAVFIKHNADGKTWYTYYGHLKNITPGIPKCYDTTPISRGEKIGEASSSGADDPQWVHLHFEVKNANDQSVDPYDLKAKRSEYPDPLLQNGKVCGSDHLWRYCPTGEVLGVSTTATPEAIEGVNREYGLALVQAINDLRNLRHLTPWEVNSTLQIVAERVGDYLLDNKVNGQWAILPQEVVDNFLSENGYTGQIAETHVYFSGKNQDPSDARSTLHNGWGETEDMDNILLNSGFTQVGAGCIFREPGDGKGFDNICVVVAGNPQE